MRLILISFLILLWTSNAEAQTRTFNAHDVFKMERVIDAALSPDGNYVAYTLHHDRPVSEGKGSDHQDLFILDLSTGQSRPYITTGKPMFSKLLWKPQSQTLSFLANMGEGTGSQVFGIDMAGGSYYRITDAPHSMRTFDWSPDGKEIAYTATVKRNAGRSSTLLNMGLDAEIFEESPSDVNLYRYEVENGHISQLNSEGSVFSFEWSPTGEYIAAQVAPANLVDASYMLKRIFLIDLKKEKMEKLVDNPGKLTDMEWSPDGKHLAFVSAADISDPVSGSLYTVEIANPKKFSDMTSLTEGFEGQVNHVAWKDEKTLIYACYESVDATLREQTLGKKKSKLLLEGGQLIFSSFSHRGDMLVMSADSRKHPAELYSFDLNKKETTRHTFSNPWMKDIRFGKQEKISYEARDGLRIDGILVYPVDYKEGESYPLITYIHGGPESCEHDGWLTYYSKWGQIAAGKGYVVFYPNYRASSGRGVEFEKADHKDLAAAEFDDVLDGIDHLIDRGLVDRDKVGIGGGSYGGYFSAWAATKHSDRFAASVVFVGVSNQISKRNLTDIPYEDYYVHWRIWTNENPELIYDRSPVKYSSNSKTPTLILHGKADPRVHPSQSLELYRQLKIHGKAPVRLVWYPGEGHGNRNSPAQLDYALRTMQWFDYYLKGDQPKDQKPPQELDYGLETID